MQAGGIHSLGFGQQGMQLGEPHQKARAANTALPGSGLQIADSGAACAALNNAPRTAQQQLQGRSRSRPGQRTCRGRRRGRGRRPGRRAGRRADVPVRHAAPGVAVVPSARGLAGAGLAVGPRRVSAVLWAAAAQAAARAPFLVGAAAVACCGAAPACQAATVSSTQAHGAQHTSGTVQMGRGAHLAG
jgi:hypothetical protein